MIKKKGKELTLFTKKNNIYILEMHNTDNPINFTVKAFKVPILLPVNVKCFVPCFWEITFKINLKSCNEFQAIYK